MLLPALALFFVSVTQTEVAIPPINRGSTLFHACQVEIRIEDGPSSSISGDYATAELCVGYVNGFTDGNNFVRNTLCVGNATIGTTIRVYVTYMERHPKLLDEYKAVGLWSALDESYPCPAKNKTSLQVQRHPF